jgi:hypothetical protein
MNDLAQFKQVVLQIDRDLLAIGRLRTLLTPTDAAAADHLLEVTSFGPRIKRAQPVTVRRAQRHA